MMMLLLAPFALVALALAVWSYRSPAVGAGLAVLVYVATAIAIEPPAFQALGFHVYLEDLLGALLLMAAVARWMTRAPMTRRWLPWIPFAAAMAAAFVLGAAWHGLKAAGVEYRGFFSLCAVVLYGAAFPLGSRQMKRLTGIWLAGAAALMALAWFRWGAELLHLGIADRWQMVGGGNPWRVLNASQALYLAQAFLVLLYLRRPARTAIHLRLLPALLAITVVLLQHRSVWIAAALAWTAMVWHEGSLRWLARAAAAAALLAFAWWQMPARLDSANPVVNSIETSVEEPFRGETSTLAWRVGLWNEYLLEYAGLPRWQMLVGTGLGNPAVYHVGYLEIEKAAHNHFIFVLNRAGLLGLVALLAGYGALLWRLRGTGGHWDYIGMLLTLTISQLVFSSVYGPSFDQGLLIGAGFGMAAGRIAPHAG